MGLQDRIHAQAQNDRGDAESQTRAQRAINAEHDRQRAEIRAAMERKRQKPEAG